MNDKKAEKIKSLIDEARGFKEVARKSTKELEYYQLAARRFQEAATLSEELVQQELEIDLKSQHEVYSLYYSYEQHYCLGIFFYEKRETKAAKIHFVECAVQISRAIKCLCT
jgi:4-hydroxyphenylpyruvate dioxygenase-like putative hemolysin